MDTSTSDKFCMQGGAVNGASSNAGTTVTMKKSFKSTSYNVNCNAVTSQTSFTNATVVWAKTSIIAVNKFIVQSGYGQDTGNAYPCKWTAYGFIT